LRQIVEVRNIFGILAFPNNDFRETNIANANACILMHFANSLADLKEKFSDQLEFIVELSCFRDLGLFFILCTLVLLRTWFLVLIFAFIFRYLLGSLLLERSHVRVNLLV